MQFTTISSSLCQAVLSQQTFGTWFYYIHDHLGNTRVVFDESGNTKAYYDYLPFGKIQRAYVADTGARYKYTGKEFDNEDGIGLYYFGARYYDPEIGRWFVTDPAGQFSSPYVYSGNSPLMMVDANGEFAIVPILVMAAWQGFVNYQITGNVGSSFKAAGISALSGAAGQFASGFAPAGVLPGAAYGGATEGVIGGVVSELSGDSFGSGFAIGAAQGVITGGLDGYARYRAAYPIDAGRGSVWTGSASEFRQYVNSPVGPITGSGRLLAMSMKQYPLRGSTSIASTWDRITNLRILDLDPRVQRPATGFINSVDSELGIRLRISTGFRSVEQQNLEYAKGRTLLGKIVTNARGGRSPHQYGLAIDVAPITSDGRGTYWNVNWNNIGAMGKSFGFKWGGDWNGIVDRVHFEMFWK